jgi:transcriptional regulator with XRE-family HTH domain
MQSSALSPSPDIVTPGLSLERICTRVRANAGVSELQLARLAHIPPTALADFERGDRRFTPATERRLIAALSILSFHLVLELLAD